SNFNRASESIAEVWLPNTRVLGDLNNFTSDFRAVEGTHLLTADAAELAASDKEMEQLDRSIAQAQRSYEELRHDAPDTALYEEFKQKWSEYRQAVNQVLTLSRGNRKEEAVALYLTASPAAYHTASDVLGQ